MRGDGVPWFSLAITSTGFGNGTQLLAEKIRPFTTHRDPKNPVNLTRPFWDASGTARPPGMLWLFREPGVELLRLSRIHDTLQWADRDTCHKMSEPDLARG